MLVHQNLYIFSKVSISANIWWTSCLSGRSWHIWLPASLSAELLGSPVSQTACMSFYWSSQNWILICLEALTTSVKPELLGSRTLATCLKMAFRVCSLWVSAGWHLSSYGIPKLSDSQFWYLCRLPWLPYCSTSWEPSGLQILGPCSQDRLYDGLLALEALAPTEFLPLWLFSATHSTKTDQNYVRLHPSAQCSLQYSSFRIYHVSCGFGFCQKWGIILPSSFLQPQRKH